jgi:hypothetical protein
MRHGLGLGHGEGDGGGRGICLEYRESRGRVQRSWGFRGNLCSRDGLHRSVLDEAGLLVVGNVKHASDGSSGGGAGTSNSCDELVGGRRNERGIRAGGSDTLLLESSEDTGHPCEAETCAVDDIGTAVDANRDHLKVAGMRSDGASMGESLLDDILSIGRGLTKTDGDDDGQRASCTRVSAGA